LPPHLEPKVRTGAALSAWREGLLYPARAAVASGVLASNRGGGATGYVTRDDCAATAAALLVHGGHSERLLDVTGPVERVGGRRPTTVVDFLAAHRRLLLPP
jgi:uncharacterized protein YbjT (DUF2867 family)